MSYSLNKRQWPFIRIAQLCKLAVALMVVFSCAVVHAQDGKDYSGKTLTDTNFLNADLKGANFKKSKLNGVVFANADLTGANFEGAIFGEGKLGPTDFTRANLTGANLSEVTLKTVVSFQYAIITGANFSGLNSENARFGPTLYYDTTEPFPDFSDATLSCEFPWYWQALNTKGAKLPSCANLSQPAGGEDAPQIYVDSEPQKSKGDEQGPIPGSNATLLQNTASIQLAEEYAADGQNLAGNNIYVSSQGTDGATCGTSSDASCATIGYATTRCTQVGIPCAVLIAYGQYSLPATITIPDQVSYVGGYVGGQPSSYQSTINAAPGGAPAFIANKVTSTLQNLILVGTPAASDTVASVVMQVLNTDNVKLDTVDVHGGTGKDVAGPAAPGSAVSGVAGNAYNASSNPSAGGPNQCGSYAGGGSGGTGWNTNASCSGNWASGCSYHCEYSSGNLWGQTGGSGQSAGGGGTYNPGNACTFDGTGSATGTGGTGTKGADATVAAAAATNRIGNFSATGSWGAVTSPSGQRGNDGGGGGGGGAGQPMVTEHCKFLSSCGTDTHNGRGGGGGGSGGCGATGGVGGQMGGGTFGLVLVGSSLQVGNALKIVGAQGGTGGDAGAGVAGGTGGAGGAGCGGDCNGAAQSGAGGSGGNGGASGGGAGGNGGPSVGLVLISGATFDKGPTSIYPGASGVPGNGAAGAGAAPGGEKGQTGLAQATYAVQ